MKYLYFLCLWLANAALADQAIPVAANYRLPVIGKAANGQVLTDANQSSSLQQLMQGKIVLLSFIYTTCSDVNGCPLATRVLHSISRRLQQQPEIQQQLRMLTLSFDPEHDTPSVLRQYATSIEKHGVDWQFLTSDSQQHLQAILDAYQQPVSKVYDQEGHFTGSYQHLLRVFLIDRQQNIRNIYNSDLLSADTLINDINSLLQASNYPPAPAAKIGVAMDLLANALKPPLGLPPMPQPADNRLSKAKIELGRKLFYDRRLSFNNTFSCAICHIPEQGFSNHEMATAVGVEGRSVRRNSPSLFNVGYAQLLFHDGRENSLEQQAWGPLLAHNEMANPSIGFVVDKINRDADYRRLFQLAFKQTPNMQNIGQALASYQRALNAADSPFDHWYYRQQNAAISPSAQRGFALFTGKAQCSQCHTINAQYALFSDQQRHNTGIGYRAAMQSSATPPAIQLIPGMTVQLDSAVLRSISEPKANDLGYYEISQQPQDRWTYKTPSLRNIALTAPYMHDGSLATLEEVLNFYNQGGVSNETLSPFIKPLNLTATERDDLKAFLLTLTGGNVDEIIQDAAAVPRGESE